MVVEKLGGTQGPARVDGRDHTHSNLFRTTRGLAAVPPSSTDPCGALGTVAYNRYQAPRNALLQREIQARCSGYRRGSLPRPLTIYAAGVEDVSLGFGDCRRALTNSERCKQRRRERAQPEAQGRCRSRRGGDEGHGHGGRWHPSQKADDISRVRNSAMWKGSRAGTNSGRFPVQSVNVLAADVPHQQRST